jgi:xylulokinase
VSPLWRQLRADICGKPGLVSSTYQGGVLGAAVLAMVGTRAVRCASSTIDEIVLIVDVCKPTGENCGEHNRLYGIYKRLHVSMQPFFGELAEFEV